MRGLNRQGRYSVLHYLHLEHVNYFQYVTDVPCMQNVDLFTVFVHFGQL